mgnify:CR=1 FL=1
MTRADASADVRSSLVRALELDLDHVTTVRERGWHGLGQPLKSFRDLLVLAASVFFESDPARNLWRVDEFLTLVLAPFCRRLAATGKP